ncbi:hypothetical protein RF11_14125 [Thelohanellus kitauei]|uniref:Uncharacterized protein n=1 Tax=Thelohanellus kitauei TaxID=669202 RepID=A0A0C2NK86_THEKT|nr:hypothetical protein RF11_14125 [Thelohanellus kitauei]
MMSVCEFLMIYCQVGVPASGEFNLLCSYNTITGVWRGHKKFIEIKDLSTPPWIVKVGDLVYIWAEKLLVVVMIASILLLLFHSILPVIGGIPITVGQMLMMMMVHLKCICDGIYITADPCTYLE